MMNVRPSCCPAFCFKYDNEANHFVFFVILDIFVKRVKIALSFKDNKLHIYMHTIKPLGDRVLVKPLHEEESAFGIIIAQTAKEKSERGEIIAVGPGKINESGAVVPMTVKIGQKVLFKKYAPDEIKVGQEELLIISESDILAVIE